MNGLRRCGKYIYMYTHTHTHNGMLLSHEKNEIMPFAVTRMDLEIVTLSEVSWTKKNII